MGSCRAPIKPTACALAAALLFAMPATGHAATPDDPLEPLHRALYAIHRGLDQVVFGPAARAYATVLPAPVRKAFRNVIYNLKEPAIAVNDLLQAHPMRAGKTTARFVINSTAGVGGLMDVAYNAGLQHHDNGFGTTAGRYGIQPGPYLFIPFIGPSNFRDLLGYALDIATDPLGWHPLRNGQVYWAHAIVEGLDTRAEADPQLQAIDATSTDAYASLRSLFEQNRAGQIQEAITGIPGSAEPQFENFDDPAAAPAAPGAPASPPPATANPGSPETAPGPTSAPAPAAPGSPSAAIDEHVNALLLSPLKLVSSRPVESVRAG